MNTFLSILGFLKQVLFATASQLFWLLGLIFIFGFILYFLARFTRNTFAKASGTTLDVFITGWVGTPVHELGHAIFCIIFRHRIDEIKLFSPNSQDGTLGYVNHSYDSNSIYQKVGNFFIGIGPILFGTFVLYILLYFLLPNAKEVLSSICSQGKVLVKFSHGEFSNIFSSLWITTKNSLSILFQKENFSSYKFWIFLYFSMCISSHMELSPPDIKGAWRGLLSIILLFLFFNIFIIGIETIWHNDQVGNLLNYIKIENYSNPINRGVGIFGSFFILATILSGTIFFITYFILNIYSVVKGKGIINPF